MDPNGVFIDGKTRKVEVCEGHEEGSSEGHNSRYSILPHFLYQDLTDSEKIKLFVCIFVRPLTLAVSEKASDWNTAVANR